MAATRVSGAALLVASALLVADASASTEPLWGEAARVDEIRVVRLRAEAGALASDDDMPEGSDPSAIRKARLRTAAARLREALSLRPDDLASAFALADVEAMAGRPAAAAEALERALPFGRGSERAIAWFRLGVARSRLGRHQQAAAAYGAAVAAGAADSTIYANLGEVLMAEGRLAEAQARYRDAIATATEPGAGLTFGGERRARAQDLALGYYGLSVALDRGGQPIAAHEMMARGLAHDPGAAVLKSAAAGGHGGELFFVPEGDVFYYLGLAAEVQGRTRDAEANFREFLARLPQSRWRRAAESHVSDRSAGDGRGGGPARGGGRARVVAQGTVLASGPIPAPLVDAGWRDQPDLLDPCLERVAAPGAVEAPSLRIAIELELDGQGRVGEVTAKVPASLGDELAGCIERVVKQRFRITAPPSGRSTRARTELIVVFTAAPTSPQ